MPDLRERLGDILDFLFGGKESQKEYYSDFFLELEKKSELTPHMDKLFESLTHSKIVEFEDDTPIFSAPPDLVLPRIDEIFQSNEIEKLMFKQHHKRTHEDIARRGKPNSNMVLDL